jgi:hypothetical protein
MDLLDELLAMDEDFCALQKIEDDRIKEEEMQRKERKRRQKAEDREAVRKETEANSVKVGLPMRVEHHKASNSASVHIFGGNNKAYAIKGKGAFKLVQSPKKAVTFEDDSTEPEEEVITFEMFKACYDSVYKDTKTDDNPEITLAKAEMYGRIDTLYNKIARGYSKGLFKTKEDVVFVRQVMNEINDLSSKIANIKTLCIERAL